jgi:hypothetical protein
MERTASACLEQHSGNESLSAEWSRMEVLSFAAIRMSQKRCSWHLIKTNRPSDFPQTRVLTSQRRI